MENKDVSAILIPGLGSSHRAFSDLVGQKELSRLDTIFYDYAGFHDRPQSTVAVDALHAAADEVLQIASQHFSDAGAIIGHSMGGVVALLAARKNPDIFAKGVVLIESNMTRNDGGMVSRKWAGSSLEEARDNINSTIERVGSLSPGFNIWASDLQRNSPEVLKAYAQSLVSVSDTSDILLETFQQMICPHGYIYGDGYTKDANAALIAKLQPHAYPVSGAGHFVMQDNPAQSARIVAKILDLT